MAGPHTDAPAAALISGPAFVGRQAEVAQLVGALAGPPALVLVEGEAGIGKTRLVDECLRAPELAQRFALVAGCPPLREPFPLGPVVDVLHRLRGRLDDVELSPLAGALRPLLPEWSDILPPAPESLDDPKATRHRLFRAVAELIAAAGVDVLVVEDAHWADIATLELLLMLATTAGRDIALVVTYRPTDVPPGSALLSLTSRPGRLTRVRVGLEPLSVDETTRLVASMFATDQVSEEFVSFLHERTGGVPLALEESVSLLHDRGDIVRRGDGWTRRAVDELQVPPTVRDSVLERVERLPSEARQVLEAAATLADPADDALLAQVAGLDAAATSVGLAAALTSGLLRESEPGRFVCRHALASRAVEEAVAVSERRRLHARAAAALRELDPQPVTRLSRHYREAHDVAAWSQYAEAAADLALESGEDRAAVVLLHDLLGAEHPPARRITLARKLGEAATWGVAALGELASMVTHALSEVLAGEDIPAGERGELRLLLGRLRLQLGEFDAASDEIEAAVGDLDGRPDLAARAMISLAFPRGHGWPARRHLEWLDRATDLVPLVSSREERTWLAVDRASALLMLGEEDGWKAAADIDAHDPTLFEQRQLARCLMNVGHLAIAWGRDDVARSRLDAAVELMAATGYQRLTNSAHLTIAHLDWHAGAWDGLAERVGALADADDTLPEAHLEAALVLAQLDLAGGQRSRARDHLQMVLADATRRGLVDVQCAPAAALGRLYLAEGDAAEAVRVTAAGIDLIARKQMWVWATDIAVVHVEALVATGRVDDATALVEQFEAGLGDLDAPGPQAARQVCTAIIAAARGDARRAADRFGAAAAAWSKLPRPYAELLAAERQGHSLVAAGAEDDALGVLATVQARLRELGAGWDADRVAQLLRRHGVEVARTWRGGRRGYGDQLSPREVEVVRLVSRGDTNRQVAEALYLSPRTVDRHLSRAMHKLGVSSRTALAVAAGEAGLLTDATDPTQAAPPNIG